jgi:hypothetical protein
VDGNILTMDEDGMTGEMLELQVLIGETQQIADGVITLSAQSLQADDVLLILRQLHLL